MVDQSPDLVPDIEWIDRRIRRIRRQLIPGAWGLFGIGCAWLMAGIGLAALVAWTFEFGILAISGFGIGLFGAGVAWDRARSLEQRFAPWRISQPILTVLLDRVETPPDPETFTTERAVLLVNANPDIARDAEDLLDLRDHVLTHIATLPAGQPEADERPNARQWLEQALSSPDGMRPFRIGQEAAGDRSTWLLSVPFMSEHDLPESGDDGVLLIPALRARPGKKDTMDQLEDFLVTYNRFRNPISTAIGEAIAGNTSGEVSRDVRTHKYPYPRVRVIPARFWNEMLNAQSRLPG